MSIFESAFNYFKDSQNSKPIIMSVLTTLIVSVPATYVVIDNTIIKGNTSIIEYLNKDRNFFSIQDKNSRDLLDKQIASEEYRINKRIEDIKHFYDIKISVLEQNYKNLSQDRDILASQLEKYQYNTRLSLENNNNAKIAELRNSLNNIDRSINFLYISRAKLNSEYGYSQKECERKANDFYSNVCQQASKTKAEMDSLMEQVISQEKRRNSIQEEILSLQRKTAN